MNNSICPSCGSKNLFADRALAGRLVCRDCASPVGSLNSSFPKSLNNNQSIRTYKYIFIFALTLIVILIFL